MRMDEVCCASVLPLLGAGHDPAVKIYAFLDQYNLRRDESFFQSGIILYK